MPFILFNSRQHRRVLVKSSQQSFSRHTTYISSGILQKPTSDYLHSSPTIRHTSDSHSYTKHQSDLSSQPQTFKLSQSHQNTQTGSTSPFMVTSETPIKSKVRCNATIIQTPMHPHIHLIARHRQKEEARNIPHPLKCEEPYSKLSVLRVGVTEYRRLAISLLFMNRGGNVRNTRPT